MAYVACDNDQAWPEYFISSEPYLTFSSVYSLRSKSLFMYARTVRDKDPECSIDGNRLTLDWLDMALM